MIKYKSYPLSNQVVVNIREDESTLEEMIDLAHSQEFIDLSDEIKSQMIEISNQVVVFDDFIAYKNDWEGGKLSINLDNYSDVVLIYLIDHALSFLQEPIKIIDKTQNTDIDERLELRINPENFWLEYDKETQILSEKNLVPCPVREYFMWAKDKKRVFTVSQYENLVSVTGFTIKRESKAIKPHLIESNFVIIPDKVKNFYSSMEEVENYFQDQGIKLVHLPLKYCNHSRDNQVSCFLRIMFEEYMKSNKETHYKYTQ